MIQITPQFYRTHDGRRPLTYAIYFNDIFCGYARCWCQAQRAAEWLELTLR